MELIYPSKNNVVYFINYRIYFYSYEYIFHSEISPEGLSILQRVKLSCNMSIMKLFLLL